MDVLCCLVLDYNSVKKIEKKLKQPHSTISEKLRFLIKNKVVKKNKWKFEVNWKELIKLMRESQTGLIPKNRKLKKLFNDERLRRIMEAHSQLAVENGFEFLSINDIVWSYLLGMSQLETNELGRINKSFLEIKKELWEETSQEKYLFLAAEGKDMDKKVHIKLKSSH